MDKQKAASEDLLACAILCVGCCTCVSASSHEQQKSLPFREAFLLPLLLYSRCFFVLAFAAAFAAAAF